QAVALIVNDWVCGRDRHKIGNAHFYLCELGLFDHPVQGHEGQLVFALLIAAPDVGMGPDEAAFDPELAGCQAARADRLQREAPLVQVFLQIAAGAVPEGRIEEIAPYVPADRLASIFVQRHRVCYVAELDRNREAVVQTEWQIRTQHGVEQADETQIDRL